MLRSLGVIAEDWLSLDGRKRFIVKDDGSLCWINDAAAASLEAGGALRIEQGKLVTDTPEDAEVLSDLLESDAAETVSAIGGDENFLVLRRLHLPRRNEDRLHLFEFRTADDAAGELAGFEAAFGLTPTEAAVVRELAAGKTVEALAESLAISRETARTHVRRIYSKTAAKSREELFARMRPFLFE